VRIRIGICSGPVVAGVIGRNRISYDLWGNTINLACRLKSAGEGGSITVTESTYERLRDKFVLQQKTAIDIKGLGAVTAFELTGRV
jgi:adenylate cyclase